MDEQRFDVAVAEGRVLEVVAAGPEDGIVLLFHNGTPSGPVIYEPFAHAAAERGMRLVEYARPGYSGSTRQPGRAVAGCAEDVVAIATHLGADRVLTAGWSGGGPHALATAALVPDRVMAAATIAAVAPWGAEGLDWLAGMGKENVEEFGAALAGPEELQAYLETAAKELADVSGPDVADALGDLIPDVDRSSLTGEFADNLSAAFRRAISSGIWGWFDDDLAFVRDWGFDLGSIRVPLSVWQGAKDRMVPFAHGEWLVAHIAGAKPKLFPDHGHLSIVVASFGEILDDLLANAG